MSLKPYKLSWYWFCFRYQIFKLLVKALMSSYFCTDILQRTPEYDGYHCLFCRSFISGIMVREKKFKCCPVCGKE
mgnify:CR=1 FL=1